MQKFVQVFTSQEHPLVMFLDDLQWADSASLNMLQLLMMDTGYLLVLGAYRDNEVSPVHPFILTVDEIVKSGATVNTITLQPLSEPDMNLLVADTLNCESFLAQPLTELVYQKTKGNPFFATQFLKALHDDQLISFDWEIQHWQCDIALVQALAITDDVVEFMALQLQKLPRETQDVLKLAACIGSQFDLNTLVIISEKSAGMTATALWKALQEGLVIPTTKIYKFFTESDSNEVFKASANPTYRFLHDRVQQAAYLLIPDERKQATHLQIGQLLSKNTVLADREEIIFDIVNQLNRGRYLLNDTQEKEKLSKLNLVVGRKAKTSTAYAAACEYMTTGMELLAEDSWNTQYDLCFALHKERVEVEYLKGNVEESKIWSVRTLEQAKTPLDKAEIYNLAIIQYTLLAEYPEAIAAGIQALSLLGIDLTDDDFELVRDREIATAQAILESRAIASLSDLPMMTDPEKKMATKLAIAMGPPTYRSHQRLWSVICAKAVNLCLQYGNTPEVGYIYPAYGGLRGYALNNYQDTGELIDLTLQLMPKFNNCSAESVAYLMIGSSLRHWSHPLKVASQDYQNSYQIGLESSNLQYAAYAFGHHMYCHFYQGVELKQLEAEINHSLAFSKTQKNQWAIDLLTGGQMLVSSLRGTITWSEIREAEYLERCRSHKNWQVICIYHILKSQILYLYDRPNEALEYAQKAEDEIVNVAPQGLLPYARHRFIYALLLCQSYHQTLNIKQSELWQRLVAYQQQLAVWVQNCPDNFSPAYELVSAEMARVSGDKLATIELYDRAIASASKSDFIQEEALANELAAKFYLEWGKEKVAQAYMIEAYYCYARWGAKAKIDDLEKRYPRLLGIILQQPQSFTSFKETIARGTITSTHSSSSNSEFLDLPTLIKASQTLSGEIELDKLLTTLLKIAIANAGATKCVLLLKQKQYLQVAALLEEGHEPELLPSIPLESSQDVAISLVNTVKRSLKPLVIVDARVSFQLASDRYIEQHQPISVLCIPILNQGQLIGVLYLENNLTVGAFTSDRIEVLNLLASQAAISLENARLYQESQQAFTALKQAQIKIVQSEKMSALGNLVAGVAHEINNPVGFLVGNIQPALDYIKDLFGLLDLYQEKYPQLDPEIQEEIENIDLEYIREDLPKLVGSMREGVKRIRDISTSLRTFSRADTNYPIACNIHDGIDSTIMILKHRLKANETRPEIKVIREYGNLPQVECYAGQLNQVFMNLLGNAIDALDESNQGRHYAEIVNEITIKTDIYLDKKQAIICIKDNGVGMSEAVQEKIFDELFTTKEVGKGTGLGLAIARQIVVEKHSGMLEVNSTLGRGTEFTISLPC